MVWAGKALPLPKVTAYSTDVSFEEQRITMETFDNTVNIGYYVV